MNVRYRQSMIGDSSNIRVYPRYRFGLRSYMTAFEYQGDENDDRDGNGIVLEQCTMCSKMFPSVSIVDGICDSCFEDGGCCGTNCDVIINTSDVDAHTCGFCMCVFCDKHIYAHATTCKMDTFASEH